MALIRALIRVLIVGAVILLRRIGVGVGGSSGGGRGGGGRSGGRGGGGGGSGSAAILIRDVGVGGGDRGGGSGRGGGGDGGGSSAAAVVRRWPSGTVKQPRLGELEAEAEIEDFYAVHERPRVPRGGKKAGTGDTLRLVTATHPPCGLKLIHVQPQRLRAHFTGKNSYAVRVLAELGNESAKLWNVKGSVFIFAAWA